MQTLFENEKFKWINLQNPTKIELNEIATKYCFQKLTIEDSLEPGHLPKYESDDSKVSFLLIRFFDKEHRMLKNTVREFSHKISIYIGADFIVTVHQKETDIFEKIHRRVHTIFSFRHLTHIPLMSLLITAIRNRRL